MSCGNGDCGESWKRRNGLILFGALILLFIVLSAFSFLDSRGQVTPYDITYNGAKATEGKRIFQAYNCMDCHTMVGNGAYYAPDLTKIYAHAGPAWLEAFLPSAGGWPTDASVQVQLTKGHVAQDAGTSSLEEYYIKFPGAKIRVVERGGHPSNMPNLPFTPEEITKLIAYLKYTSSMNTEGWPPEIKVKNRSQLIEEYRKNELVKNNESSAPASQAMPAAEDIVSRGKQLAANYGCIACHTVDGKRSVGPSWKGIFDHDVELQDGTTVKVDAAYLTESMLEPDAKVVKGFNKGVMPSFKKILSSSDTQALISYIQSMR